MSGGCGTGSDACSAVEVCSPRWRPWYRGTCGITCGITCGRTPRRVPVRHTPGAATAAPSSIELLNWRTRPPRSQPLLVCDVAATRRSDRRLRSIATSCVRHAQARRLPSGAPYGFASWWVATGADRGSGPARPPGHAAAFVCGPRGGSGCGVPDMRSRHTHKYRERLLDLDARRRSGRAGRLGCGGGRPGRGSPGARTLHTHDTGIRVLVGTGASECDNVAVALGTLFAYCLL